MTTERMATPREVRAAWRADVSRILAGAILRHDATQAEVARECGVKPGLVQKWCDPEEPHTPSAADIALMPREVGLELQRWISAQTMTRVVDDLQVDRIEDDRHILSTIVGQMHGLQMAYLLALEDGHVSMPEAREIATAAEMVERVSASLRLLMTERGTLQ